MRECGECRACCEGWLIGNAYGIEFGHGKPCGFLTNHCTIYAGRPEMCRKFYCGWIQELFPSWMQPNLCKVLISVENWSDGQFLKCIEMGQKMSDDVLLEISNFCKNNNAPYALQYEGQWKFFGPQKFIEWIINKSNCTDYKNS